MNFKKNIIWRARGLATALLRLSKIKNNTDEHCLQISAKDIRIICFWKELPSSKSKSQNSKFDDAYKRPPTVEGLYVRGQSNVWRLPTNPMSGIFRNIDPPPLTARRVCTPPPLVRGKDTLAGWRGGGGSIVRKMPDTALYSMYVSTLCRQLCILIWS